MMTLLEKHSLNAIEQFQPVSQTLNLAERASVTSIVVGSDALELAEGDWVRDDTEPGKGIVWRVKTVEDNFDTDTRTIQLEHIINTLRDTLVFGEVKPSDMGGSTNCTAAQAIAYMLGFQNDWVLGTCSYNVSNPYNFSSDYIFDALETVSGSLADCWWNYDMSSYPFTLNILERAEAVSVEMRMTRNIQKAKRTVDRSRMYTRIYPIGKNNLHIDGNYRSKNEEIYGRIDKTVTDQSKATKAELLRWAEELLDRHCEPSMTVTVTALDLSKGTGESLDHIVLGALCRMPLPKYDVIIEEIITKINYPDKIKEPDNATVTMANVREDVASIINQLIKGGGASGKTHAKQGEEDHAWIDDTTEHVRLVAEAFIGRDSQGQPVDWSRVASLGADQNGISGRVTATEGDMVVAQAAITANENAITAEVTRATGAEESLSGQISVEAGKISQIVTAVGDNGEVTAASICLAINQSGESEAVINANKIYLLGQTIANTITANYIESKIASLSVLNVAAISATGNIHTSNGYIAAPYYYIGSGNSLRNMSSGIWALRITQSGNTYTLQKQDWDDADWVDVGSFSRATSLSGAWSGRNFIVTASPQGNIKMGTVYGTVVPDTSDPVTYYTSGNNHYVKRKHYIYSEDENGDADSVIWHDDISIDAGDAYDAGYTAGSASGGQTQLSNSWAGGKITVTASPQGVTLERTLQAGTATWNGNIATIPISSVYGSSGQYSEGVVFSPTLDVSSKLTDAGYAGRAAVTLNNPAWSTTSNPGTSNTVSVSTSGRTNSSGTADNLSKSTTLVLTQGSWSNNKIYVYMREGSSSGTIRAQSQVDASSLVTSAGYAGRAAVTLNDPSWNSVSSIGTSRTVTVSTSGRTDSSGSTSNLSKSVALYLTQGSWSSGNTLEVSLRTGSTSGTVVAKSVVDASARVTSAGYAGRATVTLNDPSWNSVSNIGTSRTVSVSTSGRTNDSGTTANLTKSVGLYLTQGSWGGTNNSVITVYMREGSSSGTVRAQIQVDATSRYANGWNANKNAWIDYGSLSSYQGVLEPGSYIKTITSDINGNAVNNSRGGYWGVPAAHLITANSAGADHQGDLASDAYYELVYLQPGGAVWRHTGKTWHTPAAGSSHNTRYVLECLSKSQSYPGGNVYDYTFKLYSNATSFSVGTSYNFYR